MAQNRSNAVMATRVEPSDSLDFFPTPPWATRALFEHVIGTPPACTGWDPACGDGAMARPMSEYLMDVSRSDVRDYGVGAVVHDFLLPFTPPNFTPVDWIITNPPFRLAEQFVKRGLEIAHIGVAMLVRTAFIESAGRYEGLFSAIPPQFMAQFVERVPMVKGRLDRKASTATSYCWLVWFKHHAGATTLIWIPPCRAHLERDADYAA